MMRLDRFLIIDAWDCFFGGVVHSLLPRPTLDHFSMLSEGGGDVARGLMPFRFENMWLKVDGFKELVSNWWQSTELFCVGSYILMEKIKSFKQRIKSWNKVVFGRVEERKKESLKKVEH